MPNEKPAPPKQGEKPTPPKPGPPVDKNDKHELGDFDPPQPPNHGDHQPPPNAPMAVDPTAVGTTDSGLKVGWQHAAVREPKVPGPCSHMGLVQARIQVPEHDLGHEWVCPCGTVFEVAMNSGDKKVLKEKA